MIQNMVQVKPGSCLEEFLQEASTILAHAPKNVHQPTPRPNILKKIGLKGCPHVSGQPSWQVMLGVRCQRYNKVSRLHEKTGEQNPCQKYKSSTNIRTDRCIIGGGSGGGGGFQWNVKQRRTFKQKSWRLLHIISCFTDPLLLLLLFYFVSNN